VAFRGFTEFVPTNSSFRNRLKGTYSSSKVAISERKLNGETDKKRILKGSDDGV
jgi:hypothetical protein